MVQTLSLPIFFSFLFIISSHLGEFSSFQSKKELKNCSFNFIISMFLCMYLSYMIRNRSQKFWDIYQGYLLTFEQGDSAIPQLAKCKSDFTYFNDIYICTVCIYTYCCHTRYAEWYLTLSITQLAECNSNSTFETCLNNMFQQHILSTCFVNIICH